MSFIDAGYEEVIVPSIWEQRTFIEKADPEIIGQMWAFDDKGGRPVLIPEVTGLVQELWRDDWSKRMKNRRIFYTSRCYRYERPQAGRYREFTQFGIELLGDAPDGRLEVIEKYKHAKMLSTACPSINVTCRKLPLSQQSKMRSE